MRGRLVQKTGMNPAQVRPTIPRLGKIKIGDTVSGTSAKGKAYERPRSLDYFIATNYNMAFIEAYGDKPKELMIVFFDERPEVSCDHRIEYRDGKVLTAFGDGQSFFVKSKKDGELYPRVLGGSGKIAISDQELSSMGDKSEVLTLRFMLPKINAFGHWEFNTKAVKSTIPEIVGVFDQVQASAGRVSGIPFKLVVERVESTNFNDGEKIERHFSIVKLIPMLGNEDLLYVAKNMEKFNLSKLQVISEGYVQEVRELDSDKDAMLLSPGSHPFDDAEIE